MKLNFKNENLKNSSKGITLIALIITIIVLLILAGVSIATLMGENGILTRAQSAKNVTQEKEIEEQIKLSVMYARMNDKNDLSIDTELLETELKSNLGTGITITKKGTNESLPWEVTKGNYTFEIKEEGKVAVKGEEEEPEKVILDSTAETTPWLPTEDTIVTNNDLDTGLTIADSEGNEWVWIEVPKSITASAEADDEIETALKNYAATLVTDRGNYKDEWYALDGKTLVTASTEGLTDEQKALDNGCGLTLTEYNTKKSAMLQSIKANGGFYIGKYEVGYELGEGESVRSYGYDYSTEHPITQTPVIKENAYPYNWVRCSQAQELSESLATEGKTSSLMFGTQWDLVLKYLSVKENGKTADELTSDSGEWGNYFNKSFDITQGKYSEDYGATWKDVEGTYTKPASSRLLTTGATLRNSSMNIYDLAGNVFEWTLEYTSYSYGPCSRRGGYYGSIGSDRPASYRDYDGAPSGHLYDGFRPSLY